MTQFRIPNLSRRSALTLAELVVVLAILVVLGSLVLPAAGRFTADTRESVTRLSLSRLRDVIAEIYWQDDRDRQLPRPGTAGLTAGRVDHPQLRYLFVNPTTTPDETAAVTYDYDYLRGWRGPYLVHRDGSLYTVNAVNGFTTRYGLDGDPTVLDGWGRPIVLQNPSLPADTIQDVRLVSAGPDGILQTPAATATAALTATITGDDVLLPFEVRR